MLTYISSDTFGKFNFLPMFACDMDPVVVVVVVLVVVFDLASAAFCASLAARRLGFAPIITLNSW